MRNQLKTMFTEEVGESGEEKKRCRKKKYAS